MLFELLYNERVVIWTVIALEISSRIGSYPKKIENADASFGVGRFFFFRQNSAEIVRARINAVNFRIRTGIFFNRFVVIGDRASRYYGY